MAEVYDSNRRMKVFSDTFFSLWKYRALLAILVRREIAVRYKRSYFGLLWTLLNPLFTALVLWFVFITIFSSKLPDGTQFAPYVLSGVLLITFFTQGFNQSADSIAKAAKILTKVYVPPQVFAFSTAIANAVNFIFGLIALALISLITGDGISLKFPIVLIVVVYMTMFVTGLGLIVAILYIRFDDTRNIFSIFVSFMMYLAPVFYPKEILSDIMVRIIDINPLTSYLDVFRYIFSNTGVATLGDWVYMALSSLFAFILGIRWFGKYWPKTVVML